MKSIANRRTERPGSAYVAWKKPSAQRQCLALSYRLWMQCSLGPSPSDHCPKLATLVRVTEVKKGGGSDVMRIDRFVSANLSVISYRI
jgi:hypothetical protein